MMESRFPRLLNSSICMQKLDRVGWPTGISFTSFGVRVGIRVSNSEVLSQVQDCLPPRSRRCASDIVDVLYSLVVGGASRTSAVKRYNMLYIGAGRALRTLNMDEMLRSIETWLPWSVGEKARRCLFVRAGVVGWQGRAILVTGPPQSGVSTLVHALVNHGATYYSDSYAVFDDRGHVLPYPTRLRLPKSTEERAEQLPLRVGRGMSATDSLPLGLVLDTAYRPGVGWHPRAVTPGETLFNLLEWVPRASNDPKFVMATLTRVLTSVRILKSARGEAASIVNSVLSQLCAGS